MRILYLSLVIVVFDQLSKIFVKGFSIPFLKIHVEGMFQGQRIPVLGDFFRITYIENPGMAFGIDPGIDYKLLISVFSLIASIGLIIYIFYVKDGSKSLKIALACILGGAAGNLIDRMFYGVFYHYAPLFYGRVVDFLDVDFFNITIFGRSYDRWPIFNIADSAVTIGVLILLLFYKQVKKDEVPVTETTLADIVIPETDEITSEEISEQENSNNENDETKREGNSVNGKPDNGKEIPL
jgi:signal peptidase II